MLSAKVLLLLFLASGTTSYFYGKKIHEGLPALKQSLASEEKKLNNLNRDARVLAGSLTPDEGPVNMNQAMTDTILALMRNRVAYGVHVASISPHKGMGTGTSNDISKMVEPVPNTKVQSVRLNLRGSYKSYEAFEAYLAEVRKLPTAIVHLKVDGNTFEMGVRVYGN